MRDLRQMNFRNNIVISTDDGHYPVVLYGCETWSLTLRDERRLRVFENKILRRIFWPKRDENGEWRRFHNEELHISIVKVVKSRRLR